MDLKIDPVETYIMDGIVNRVAKVFKCPATLGNAVDKVKVLERLSNKNASYPYIFINEQRLGANTTAYASNRLARTGVRCLVNDDLGQLYQVRLMPTNFELELQFITNALDPRRPGSVREFQKKWLFAQRAGYLKFNVNYGDVELRIGVTLSDSIDTPQLENKVEQPAHYECTGQLTVHGYVSDPYLKNVGVVSEVNIQEILGTNSTFVPYQELK